MATQYDNVKVGKFDIFAAYMYAKGLQEGMPESEAKVYGYSIAVLGARARNGGGRRGGGKTDTQVLAQAAGKKKSSITSAQYNRHMEKLGAFYTKVFLPRIKKLVKKGVSYEDVKVIVDIPRTIGAKITGAEFTSRTE